MAFTRRQNVAFRRRVERELAKVAKTRARPIVRKSSRTLARSLRIEPFSRGYKLSIPYYWAIFIHDGRRAINLPRGKFMVFFKDPNDDIRHRGKFPRTEEEVQHLSKDEFYFLLNQNARNRAFGLPPVMIVTRRVSAVKPNRFFSKGLKGIGTDKVKGASGVVPEMFSDYVLKSLAKDGLLEIKDEATFKLG